MTDPAATRWGPTDPRYRRSTASAVVGSGDAVWRRAVPEVLRWGVKTRSGFRVEPPGRVRVGARLRITARVLGVTVVEPVEVVEVVERADRVGFAYRTLPGHPVSGQEAFVLHRDGDRVVLTIRSLTRPSRDLPWRLVFPLLLVAQRVVRRRYLRALRRA